MAHELSMPRRILLGPGPSDVNPRVLRAMSTPLVGHLDPSFVALMEDVKELLRQTFRTEEPPDLPAVRDRQRRHGGGAGQPARAGRPRRDLRERRVRRAPRRDRAALRRRGDHRRGAVGRGDRRAACCASMLDALPPGTSPRLVAVRARRDLDRRAPAAGGAVEASRTSAARCSSSTRSPRSPAPRSRSTPGASTPATAARRSACRARRGCRR